MTPQRTRKAPLRNTSAVPRTRKTAAAREAIEKEEEAMTTAASDVTPKTPRSIPLPSSAKTPYDSPVARVSPEIVLSTPRGPVSLHKALLLHSARKVWRENRSVGVDGAIEVGDVEVRRKSLSPRVKMPSPKAMTSIKFSVTPVNSRGSVDREEAEEVEEAHRGQLQRIYEGRQAVELADDPDSDTDSLNADLSLDMVSARDHHRAETDRYSLLRLS